MLLATYVAIVSVKSERWVELGKPLSHEVPKMSQYSSSFTSYVGEMAYTKGHYILHDS